ncbi:MAG: hypothetical protein ACOCXG_03150 [Nanoarchaeota archaeon]
MVAKKQTASDNLYINFYNAQEKRKDLLTCIKNSLVMQEEYEKLIKVRAGKKDISNEIKKRIELISSKYQDLKKLLPNVEAAILNTQKDLEKLEPQKTPQMKKKKVEEEKIVSPKTEEKKESKPKTSTKSVPTSKPQNVGKLDRIKNNLKVIEAKLNRM